MRLFERIERKKKSRGSLSNATGINVQILSYLPIANVLLLNYKMNAIVNMILLAGDKFMSEMHLRQLAFTYIACAPFTKNKER